MLFDLSETMVLLVYVFSHLIAQNYRSQVHVVTVEVPRILKETLMLLKPLNGMRFNVLDILSGRQSSSMFLTSLVLPPMLWNMENHHGRSANKQNFSLQLILL